MNRNFAKLESDNKITYAPDGVIYEGRFHTRPTAAMYAANGWLPIDNTKPEKIGVYFVSTEYGDLVDGCIVRRYDERPIVAPPSPVTRYSKLKLITAAKKRGKWDALKAFIETAGYWDEWLVCQYLADDYEGFADIKAAAASALQMTENEVDALLVECIDEEVA